MNSPCPTSARRARALMLALSLVLATSATATPPKYLRHSRHDPPPAPPQPTPLSRLVEPLLFPADVRVEHTWAHNLPIDTHDESRGPGAERAIADHEWAVRFLDALAQGNVHVLDATESRWLAADSLRDEDVVRVQAMDEGITVEVLPEHGFAVVRRGRAAVMYVALTDAMPLVMAYLRGALPVDVRLGSERFPQYVPSTRPVDVYRY